MADQTGTTDEVRAKLTKLIKDARICMFTTTTEDGRQVSRPMGLQDVEFDGDLWFFAYQDAPKIREITLHPEVNVSFSDQKNAAWVSVSGRAEVVHDRDKAEQLWNPMLRAWFPDGLDTPGLTLIRVHAGSAEYWDAPGGKVTTLIAYAKSAITRRPPSPGDNREVALD